MGMMDKYLANLPAFIEWWSLAALLSFAFAAIYLFITPQREMRLILHQGNVSAAVCFCGALLGYVLPLASALVHGDSLLDFLLWGLVAMLVQILVYFVMRLLIRNLTSYIEEDRIAVAILVATVSLGSGILNAAAMVY
jgi:putative membrane protein